MSRKRGRHRMCLGNHEFDEGISGLIPFVKNLTSPILSSNLILTKVPELAQQDNLKQHIVLNIKGIKIGIIGYLTPETKVLARKNDVEYIDEIKSLKKQVKILKDEGVNILIALGHSGYLRDIEIAKEVDGLDLVIGGHSNTFLYNGTTPDIEQSQGYYPTYAIQDSGRSVPVVQAYGMTKYLGRLHIIFDENGEILHIDGNPILLNKDISEDEAIMKIVQRYKTNNKYKEVVGKTSVLLDNSKCLIEECNLGNIVTDAMVQSNSYFYKGKYWTDASIGIIAGGNLRAPLEYVPNNSTITQSDLLLVLPFGGSLVIVDISGSVLYDILEHSVANYNTKQPSDEFLQFSGLKVVYDMNKPSGSRVVMAVARCSECAVPEYFKVDESKEYKVIMPDFLLNGGNGYSMIKNLPAKVLHYNERDAFKLFLEHNNPVFAEIEGRINFIDEKQASSSSFIIYPSLTPAVYTILLRYL